MLDIKRILASAPRKPESAQPRTLYTVWGERIVEGETPECAHPHPQFERKSFHSLNGWWECCFVQTKDAAASLHAAVAPSTFDRRIRVPFSPEAPLSDVGRRLEPNELLWYRRHFEAPAELFSQPDARLILHFEAVDYACVCFVNGNRAGSHVGGYLPFSFDITPLLVRGENEIILCVHDPSDAGVQPRGKQKLEHGGIWYTAQSGIWQPVWYEIVPSSRMESLAIDARADSGQLELTVILRDEYPSCGTAAAGALRVRLLDGDIEVGSAQADAPRPGSPDAREGLAHRRSATLAIDVESPHLWSPEDPHLYKLELTYGRDEVSSYCAFRSISIERDERGVSRLCINHAPVFLRGVLDQGYWPDGLMTAPSDEALSFDIETAQALGFTMMRKHIKVESDRWYYHCDRLGMLVWQDMINGGSPLSAWHTSYKPTFFRCSWGRFPDDTPKGRSALSSESAEYRAEWNDTCKGIVSHLRNHPSIITWVLFNEGWGQFDAREATDLVRALDPTRAIDAVSGWYDQACGDFLSVHNYFRPLEVYDDATCPHRAFVISEFGGLSFHLPRHSVLETSYGYGSLDDIVSFEAAVRDALEQADRLERDGLAGFVYTQLADIEEETNGLLTYDRRVNKLDNGRSAQ